jgi:hypothetical protein
MWVIVAIVVVVAIVWFVMMQNGATPSGQGSSVPAQNVQTSPTGQSNIPSGLTTAAKDDSNAALNQDLNSIDSQLNGLSSDSANIDQGLNDQPVSQGQ